MLAMKQRVKGLFEAMFDVSIYSARPHGRDDCRDICGTEVPIRTILDVGAHVGESALKFNDIFPDSIIHSFEPVARTFELLRQNVSPHANIQIHQLALGANAGSAVIYLTTHSTMSSLIRPDVTEGEETVHVKTVDEFAAANSISHIDLLKVDAEGADLDVLSGATAMLEQGRVSFVLVEVTFTPSNQYHVLFDDVRDFLERRRFSVFGIYDQQLEWSGENRLRYANACFCHETVVMAGQKGKK